MIMKTDITPKYYSKIAYVILGIIVSIFFLGHIAEFAGVLYKEMYLK